MYHFSLLNNTYQKSQTLRAEPTVVVAGASKLNFLIYGSL